MQEKYEQEDLKCKRQSSWCQQSTYIETLKIYMK